MRKRLLEPCSRHGERWEGLPGEERFKRRSPVGSLYGAVDIPMNGTGEGIEGWKGQEPASRPPIDIYLLVIVRAGMANHYIQEQ